MSNLQKTEGRRLLNNAVLLYVRMALSMLVSLYTTRVVLSCLGEEDYGLYSVVGGVVGFLSSLNASMSSATSRFITCDLGRGDQNGAAESFRTALVVHAVISAVCVVIAETAGVRFLETKLTIPDGRMDAARWVFQLSVFSMAVAFTQVPYTASVIAYEKMGVFSAFELFGVIVKLLLALLLMFVGGDKLIMYAVFMLVVQVVLALGMRWYCHTHLPVCSCKQRTSLNKVKGMLQFSGLDLYVNICGTFKLHGTTVLINMFFGTIANAACNIANIVIGSISALSANVTTAFRPQIIKSFVSGDFRRVEGLLNAAIKGTSFLLLFLAIPIAVEMPFVLKVWLGEYPDQTVVLSQIALLTSFVGNINAVLLIPCHALGKIRSISLWGGTLYLINIAVMYALLKLGAVNLYQAYSLVAVFMVFVLVADALILKQLVSPLRVGYIFKRSVAPIVIGIILVIFCDSFVVRFMAEGWLRLLAVGSVSSLLMVAYFILAVFTRDERNVFFQLIRKR